MSQRVILVDYENVQPMVEEFRRVDPLRHRMLIFHGPSQNALPIRVVEALLPIGLAVAFIQCERSGKDALDFHVAFHLGRLSVSDTDAHFVIVSRDRKGFAQLVEHGQRLGCDMRLVPSLLDALTLDECNEAGLAAGDGAVVAASTEMPDPAVQPEPIPTQTLPEPKGPTKMVAAKKAPAKKVPAKKATAKKAPVKKAAAKKSASKPVAVKLAAAKKVVTKTVEVKPLAISASASAPASVTPLPLPSVVAPPVLDAPGVVGAVAGSDSGVEAQRAVVATLPTKLHERPQPSDMAKALAVLQRMAADNRPGKLAALRRHLESHLRAELSTDGVAQLLRDLAAQGWIAEGPNGKLLYHLPSA
jgi:hypothetical protein